MDNKPSSGSPGQHPGWRPRLEAARRDTARALRRYADWLAEQSWKRLVMLALLAMIATGILSSIPPFSTRWGDQQVIVKVPAIPRVAEEAAKAKKAGRSYKIQIDDKGVRIEPQVPSVPASVPEPGASAPLPPEPPTPPLPSAEVKLPPNATSEEVKQAIEDAKEEIRDSIEKAAEAAAEASEEVKTIKGFRLGDHMMPTLMLLILASIVIKVMGQGRRKAEVQAAAATERAESESLKRQVVEARMAAMQAQVEPHFLFNTLASIDHLIETDPPRASQMQKNLIALLRASMPTMREANASGVRDLGRELAVIRPYLEILKVRMEERLQTEIDVPEGLQSAEFPPMMIQSLVENAIKHGLEPKAEGGRLSVKAEVRHGRLAVTVADTGLGFGKAATSGTGVGLANIRERLQLLYGPKATLTVTENQPSGTVVTITVPYTARHPDDGASA
jgi:hypothetical protein